MTAETGITPARNTRWVRFSSWPWTRWQSVVVSAAVATFLGSTVYMGLIGGQTDWVTYSAAALRLLAGQPIYAAAQLHGPYHLTDVVVTGYVYPPASALLWIPFASGDIGRTSWLALSVLAFVAGMLAIAHRYHGLKKPYVLAALFLSLALSGPYTEGVFTGNSSLLLAGLFAASIAAARPWGAWSGALGAVIRITPGATVLLAWRLGGRRDVAVALVVAALFVALTIPIVGLQNWRDYVTSLTGAVPSCDRLVNSPTCYLAPVLGLGVAKIVVACAAVALCIAALRVHGQIMAATLVSLAIIVPLPDLWPHYMLFPTAAAWAALLATLERVAGKRALDHPSTELPPGNTLNGRASA